MTFFLKMASYSFSICMRQSVNFVTLMCKNSRVGWNERVSLKISFKINLYLVQKKEGEEAVINRQVGIMLKIE